MKLKGGPTQDEILSISIYKLGLKHGDVFADIGCGTGKVAVHASRTAGTVYAVDRRKEAIECARQNAAEAKATNVAFFEGDALDFLKNVDALDCAFVGGTKGLQRTIEELSMKVKGGIVVNVVRIEALNEAISTMKRLGIFKEAVHVQASRSYDIAGGTMFKPIDPVYIVVGGGRKC
jgi:cobalt-precorrin-6B (C15)-methyltransferase